MRWELLMTGGLLGLGLVGRAHGCTLCESETGLLVRAGIFAPSFWGTLGAVFLPFPVIAAVLYGVNRLLAH